MSSSGVSLALRDVRKVFPPARRALDGVTLEVGAGEYLAVVGRSGSGKSTLLNILGLLDRPSEGSYEFDGLEVSRLRERDRAAIRAGSIGFVFQAFHLLPYRTVLENVMLGEFHQGVRRRTRARRAREVLSWVGLEDRHASEPATLSGGERQRVAIARAVAGRPRLLLCDEPTGNLDSETSSQVLDVLDLLHVSGMTVVTVTHDRAVSDRATRTVRLDDGRVVSDLAASRLR